MAPIQLSALSHPSPSTAGCSSPPRLRLLVQERAAHGRSPLAVRAQGPDTKLAFADLYEKYRKSVCTVAASFHSLDADDIQDVVQDTFVRAFHALAALKDTEHLAAWLSVIARNRASSFLASRGRRAKLSDDSHRDSLLCAQPPGSALEQLEQETDRRIVRREIEALQEGPEKETVLLFYIEGALTTREIAQRLGVGKSAVSMRLERFRKRVGAQVASRCAGRDRGHDK